MMRTPKHAGPHWYSQGCLQLVFMINQGLKPEHYLLDVGCGAMRGGLHFIRYLEGQHYWGIEKEKSLLDEGRAVCQANGVTKPYSTVESSQFVMPSSDPKFDFMFAQSLFTHLRPMDIASCFQMLMPILASGGSFFASYELQREHGVFPSNVPRSLDQVVYPFSFFMNLSENLEYSVEDLGDWGHPGGLRMLRFSHR